MPNDKQYFTASDVMKVMGVSRGVAYQIIRECNEQLKKLGKITVRGKVNAKFLLSKIEV